MKIKKYIDLKLSQYFIMIVSTRYGKRRNAK